jgi:hypothetical protein
MTGRRRRQPRRLETIPSAHGACENPNLPVEMADGLSKIGQMNRRTLHDEIARRNDRNRSIRSSSTPSNGERHLNTKYPSGFPHLERSLQVGVCSGRFLVGVRGYE